jgi:oligoendopeptidase F
LKLVTKAKERWIPDWLDNLQLSKDEQVVINLKYLTNAEKENVSEYVTEITDDGKRLFRVQFDTEGVLKKGVESIEHLEDEEDGKAKKIKTGLDLLNSKNERIRELAQKAFAKLTRADEMDEDTEKN